MSLFSKTQYDSFSTAYDGVNDLPITRAIIPNVERLVKPHIQGGRVLELACGTGYFTKFLLDWGAASVVGVDVSQAMVNLAKAEMKSAGPAYESKTKFMVADCSSPFTVPAAAEGGGSAEEPEQFDLVFAAWLLNYAYDQATMTAMFSNIARHLKPTGRLVTVLPHPETDPMVCIDHVNAQHKLGYGYRVEVLNPLPSPPGGYHVHLYFDTNPVVDFGNYYLPMQIHEQGAKEGGMKGKLTWEEVQISSDYADVNRYMETPLPKGFLDEWLKYPDFGILVVEKE